MDSRSRTAVLIPCHNEQQTILQVVSDFRRVLPHAVIYVFDNASTDQTAEVAARAGARVIAVPRLGKGYAVQAMFTSVDADAFIMVDGDSTYPAEDAARLLAPILDGTADMVVGSRLMSKSSAGFRPLNLWGNRLFVLALRIAFRAPITDLLSGYRAFNRQFIRSVPVFGGGFEIEAEITIKALERGLRVIEVPVVLAPRPEGSHSKIRVLKDGFVILSTIVGLMRDYKPLTIFGGLGALALIAGLILLGSITQGYLPESSQQNYLIAAIGLALAGLITIAAGFILHSVARHFQELNHTLGMVDVRPRNYGRDDDGSDTD